MYLHLNQTTLDYRFHYIVEIRVNIYNRMIKNQHNRKAQNIEFNDNSPLVGREIHPEKEVLSLITYEKRFDLCR